MMLALLLALQLLVPTKDNGPQDAVIVSERVDLDRDAGVVMFEDHVHINYAKQYDLHADQLFVFLENTNQLTRVVAIGNVAVTNDTKSGQCSMAKFTKKTGELELFGDEESGNLALLVDGITGNKLYGGVIRFWLDSEQIEVEKAQIEIKQHDLKEIKL